MFLAHPFFLHHLALFLSTIPTFMLSLFFGIVQRTMYFCICKTQKMILKQEILEYIDNQAISYSKGCLVKNRLPFILASFLYFLPDCFMSGS